MWNRRVKTTERSPPVSYRAYPPFRGEELVGLVLMSQRCVIYPSLPYSRTFLRSPWVVVDREGAWNGLKTSRFLRRDNGSRAGGIRRRGVSAGSSRPRARRSSPSSLEARRDHPCQSRRKFPSTQMRAGDGRLLGSEGGGFSPMPGNLCCRLST